MKSEKRRLCLVAATSLMVLAGSTVALAAEKRCTTMTGEKVECPVKSDEELKKAVESFGAEADAMAVGKAGSTYGIEPFDYLTGVGKRSSKDVKKQGDSGYGGSLGGDTGKTELWDRVENAAQGEAIYNQWVNNWSPSFKSTLVDGADPNAGKQWYYFYCVACHGWTLQGDGPNAAMLDPKPRTLTAGSYMQKKSNLQLFTVIKGGGEAVGLSPSMPSWGNILLDQDIWNVVAWIRANQDVGPPKSVDDYLNPKSTFKPIPGDVNALNYLQSEEFQEEQEMVEASLPGRGAGLEGGGYVEGGLRKRPEEVSKKLSAGY
ncbi:MAG TPA: cytochrome c [Sedimenticola sp.]|nr:cytochrome c [Sedimenticola sp.]